MLTCTARRDLPIRSAECRSRVKRERAARKARRRRPPAAAIGSEPHRAGGRGTTGARSAPVVPERRRGLGVEHATRPARDRRTGQGRWWSAGALDRLACGSLAPAGARPSEPGAHWGEHGPTGAEPGAHRGEPGAHRGGAGAVVVADTAQECTNRARRSTFSM